MIKLDGRLQWRKCFLNGNLLAKQSREEVTVVLKDTKYLRAIIYALKLPRRLGWQNLPL